MKQSKMMGKMEINVGKMDPKWNKIEGNME